MMLKLEIDKNNKRVMVQLSELDDRSRAGIRLFFAAFGKSLLKSFNKAVLKKPRSGRVYKIRKRRHVASKAGESPANRTGNYRKSAGYQLRGASEMLFGATAEYAGFLENGTSKMDSRPGLGNAVSETEGESLQDAHAFIKRELLK